MAEENKSEQTNSTPESKSAEGAKADDTQAKTKKPDTNAKSVTSADSKKSDKSEKGAAAKKPAAKKPAAKKKAKPPKLEDKPFNEFMEQHYLPSLKEAMAKEGIDELSLEFAKRKFEVIGQSDNDDYWQVQGQWEEPGEGLLQFNIAFLDEDIKGQKVFTLTTNGTKPSTIEQFMGDERKITLGLMVLYTVQRLNGQKWLTRN